MHTSATLIYTKMAIPIHMPARGECTAPVFDSMKHQELPSFFDDIEYLFDRASIHDDSAKKHHVLHYIDFGVAQTWKVLPEFQDTTSSYTNFKEAILSFYPEASGNSLYSLSDADLLIMKHQSSGITSIADLSSYHLQFIAITSWLIEQMF